MHELIDNPIQDSVEACPPQETNLEGKRIILILILTKDIILSHLTSLTQYRYPH